jgi:hypothetical protein
MAGGPNAATVMCIHCAEKADRIREGMETDGYRCTVCGQTFHINWDENPPTAPQWPPDSEMLQARRAAILKK